MKQKYILYFFIILSIILVFSLYFVEIPSPSSLITEDYSLNIQ